MGLIALVTSTGKASNITLIKCIRMFKHMSSCMCTSPGVASLESQLGCCRPYLVNVAAIIVCSVSSPPLAVSPHADGF